MIEELFMKKKFQPISIFNDKEALDLGLRRASDLHKGRGSLQLTDLPFLLEAVSIFLKKGFLLYEKHTVPILELFHTDL